MLSRPKIVFKKTVIYRVIGKGISDKKCSEYWTKIEQDKCHKT
jgi:hypothetical protein